MLEIIPLESLRVAENSGRLLEGNAVLSFVAKGFARVPREHISVYTLIMRERQLDLATRCYREHLRNHGEGRFGQPPARRDVKIDCENNPVLGVPPPPLRTSLKIERFPLPVALATWPITFRASSIAPPSPKWILREGETVSRQRPKADGRWARRRLSSIGEWHVE